MKYGVKQKTLRTIRGMTQAELATMAGTTQERVSDFEVGRRNPGAEEKERIMQALGWTEDVETQLLGLGGRHE